MKKFKIILIILFSLLPIVMIGCKNKNKETLSTPTILEIKGGTIVFDGVAGADYYTISIDENEVLVDSNYNSYVKIIDNKINYNASKIFVVGQSHSVKIKACAGDKNDSNYTEAVSYKHSGSIQKPLNVKINGTTLTWDVVENANFYNVKMITPNDDVIYDKQGGVLTKDDPETISNANLTEFTFNSNQFDFASLLNTAGNYSFYVCAVLTDGVNYVESGYTPKLTYSHYVNLKASTYCNVHNVNGELHLLTEIDTNANAISISCGEIEKTVEINGSEQSISKINNNFLDINLNQYFKMFIDANKLDLTSISQFTFSTLSKHISSSAENNFYLTSTNKKLVFENTKVLTKPIVNLELNSNSSTYIAKWNAPQPNELVGEYKVIIATATELIVFKLDNNIFSTLLPKDFIAVAVQSIGAGNYLSSSISDFISNPTLKNEIVSFNSTSSNFDVSWDNMFANYYIVTYNDKYIVCDSTSCNIPSEDVISNSINVNIFSIKNGFKAQKTSTTISYNPQLEIPTIIGFNATKLYELQFNKVDNAIGYYVYIRKVSSSQDENAQEEEFSKIDAFYTTTSIDLTKYIVNEGDFVDYEIRVQAVADPYGIYSNSELSDTTQVSHVKVLNKPEFYKTNDTTTPVEKQTTENGVEYILKFNGVEGAGKYEILINYNKFTVDADKQIPTDLYKVKITDYLKAANSYEIKVKAIPASTAINVKESDFAVASYSISKQLARVQNVEIQQVDNVYTLTFDPTDNAESYSVRIVKENDSTYPNYLQSIGLSDTFKTQGAVNVTDYIKQQGIYYFYVTALPAENSHYAKSQESEYDRVDKLTTLESPKDITFDNASKKNYIVSWTGDDSADYYLVKVTDPNLLTYEFKAYDGTSGPQANINDYLSIQGDYTITISSMVETTSQNSTYYNSSPASTKTLNYIYEKDHDFLRYSVSVYGESTDFVVENVNELKNLLWYHTLYEITADGLAILISPNDLNGETLKQSIIRFSHESTSLGLYNFTGNHSLDILIDNPQSLPDSGNNGDTTWYEYIKGTKSDSEMLQYLCSKLLSIYPEFSIIENLSVEHESNSNKFVLKYRNTLNAEKVNYEIASADGNTILKAGNSYTVKTMTNYGNDYDYIDPYSRKSADGVFKIDSRTKVPVTTTEQLLHAVQHNKQPEFIGNSQVAERVYENAKLVLSAIVTNRMTDLDKVTAIFDWLEYGFDLTYYIQTNTGATLLSNSIELEELETFGLYKNYYLEGIFENISMDDDGKIVFGSRLATSQSYSKAFALLCGIEGIEASIVNGKFAYSSNEINHVWNKVKLTTSNNSSANWFAVDLTMADNKINFSNLSKGYGISSHTHFLVTDNFVSNSANENDLTLTYTDENNLISDLYQTSRSCVTRFNYYANSSFGLTGNQIEDTISFFKIDDNDDLANYIFTYSKQLDVSKDYQKYKGAEGYGNIQAFMMNAIIYAGYNAHINESGRSMFEFAFDWDEYNTNNFNKEDLTKPFNHAYTNFSLNIGVVNVNNLYSLEFEIEQNNGSTIVVFIVEELE